VAEIGLPTGTRGSNEGDSEDEGQAMKFGVYMATHNNPMFLRLALLQMEQQYLRPDVLSIHQNGHEEDAMWAVRDVVPQLEQAGMKIRNIHSPFKMPFPFFHMMALEPLIEEDCDVILKWDHDDIYYPDHNAKLVHEFEERNVDVVLNTRAEVLILTTKRDYIHATNVDFGKINPTGGMSNCMVFSKDFAKALVARMRERSGKADDVVMTELLSEFRVEKIVMPPTACYVSHGRNTSTPHWAQFSYMPPELESAKDEYTG
jgi:hypothetical protein